jgi:hypothetical protein
MIAFFLIALAAGGASALMFASIISGALISLVLFYLAPLPLMVATLAWGPLCGTIGGIAAATGLGVMFGLPYCLAFAITIALPAWWLGHLALLGRPVTSGHAPSVSPSAAVPAVEWYPLGRVLLWITVFASLSTMAALLTLGTDAASIIDALRQFMLRILEQRDAAVAADTERLIDSLIIVAPAAAAGVAMLTLTLNLWLAAKITVTSGRLPRPWPDLKSVTLPPMTLAALCTAIAFCFSGALAAIGARIVTSALLLAYALVGFAVLHTLSLALKNRAFWLGSVYAIALIFVWPALALVALGVADAVFGFRQRFLRGRPPPLPVP